MSEEKPVEPIVEETVPEVVSKEAYSRVSSDMHKYKQDAKAALAKLADMQAEQEARDKSVLEEKEQWHTLYKKAEKKLKDIETERVTEKTKFIESHKVNAVLQNLGGFKKTEYNKFIDVNNISVADDGAVDEQSVFSEVERLKKEYPELIKAKVVSPLPSNASRGFAPKAVKDMSPEERSAARRALLTK